MTKVILGLLTIVVGGLCIHNAIDSYKNHRYFWFGVDAMAVACMILNLVRITFDL